MLKTEWLNWYMHYCVLSHFGALWWSPMLCDPMDIWVLKSSSVGKESACNEGDPDSIPRSGRSPGEGRGYPLQSSRASLVAQLVKNPPAMRETWVWSLAWEDPLEKEKATHSSILAWRIPWTIWSLGSQRVGHDWATFPFHSVKWYLGWKIFIFP